MIQTPTLQRILERQGKPFENGYQDDHLVPIQTLNELRAVLRQNPNPPLYLCYPENTESLIEIPENWDIQETLIKAFKAAERQGLVLGVEVDTLSL